MRRIEFLLIVRRSLIRVLRIAVALIILAAVCAAYARFVEPTWLRVRHVSLSSSPAVRIIHISDIHFAGDTRYLERVVATINRIDADCVCFTGDLIEDAASIDAAVRILSKVNKPMYGVPGNHDRWALRSFDGVRAAFRKTGGDWLADHTVLMPSKHLALMTLASCGERTPAGFKHVVLEHHPSAAAQPGNRRFDLILAGHTHGGQLRIPFLRRLVISSDPDTYDRGLFQTPCGPLYVNPGIGTFYLKMRFLCRPEITLIEI